jgi:hypothetical protein
MAPNIRAGGKRIAVLPRKFRDYAVTAVRVGRKAGQIRKKTKMPPKTGQIRKKTKMPPKKEGENRPCRQRPITLWPALSQSASLWPGDGLASLPDSVLSAVLRHLPRGKLSLLRRASKDTSGRILTHICDERMCHAIGFERRLCMPVVLKGELIGALRHLCSRFAIKEDTWSLSLKLDVDRVKGDNNRTFHHHLSCSGMPACADNGVFAAVATTPLGVQLTTGIECPKRV